MDINERQIALSVLEGLREDLTYAHLNNGGRVLDVADLRQANRLIASVLVVAPPLVDDEDYDFLMQWKWHAWTSPRGTYYAVRTERTGKQRTIRMHRLLLSAPDGVEVDHKTGGGLNNQKNNIRIATKAQNGANRSRFKNNTSGFKGVYRRSGPNKWQARIRVDNKLRHLGTFSSVEAAARVYDAAAIKYFGEFANLNFPK
jgi:hypothetical protein